MAFNRHEEYASFDQRDVLEDLLLTNRYNFYIGVDELADLEKEYFNNDLTKERADEIIYYLMDSIIENDLDKQFDNKYL